MNSFDPALWAAHRALRTVFIEGGQIIDTRDDIETATLPVYLGVFRAFFLNVMEREFSGHESAKEVAGYFTRLENRYRYLRGIDAATMAVYTLCGIRGVPLPDEFPDMGTQHVGWMELLIRAVADDSGLVGQELETYLLGSVARYHGESH